MPSERFDVLPRLPVLPRPPDLERTHVLVEALRTYSPWIVRGAGESRRRPEPHELVNAVGVCGREIRVRGPRLRSTEEDGPFRANRVKHSEQVRSPRLEVRLRHVPT